MARARAPQKPRKTPVQARSAHTVEAIHTACIQVLLEGGLEKLTTTRVAARAGVSVGSLYQYYPNKQSLLAAVLERHLLRVVQAVEATCLRMRGQKAGAMAQAVVEAFFQAKFDEPRQSRALYAVASEVSGEEIVKRLTLRSQAALGAMLFTAVDRDYTGVAAISFVLSTVLIGPVQALLHAAAPPETVADVRQQLVTMLSGHLDQVGARRKPGDTGQLARRRRADPKPTEADVKPRQTPSR